MRRIPSRSIALTAALLLGAGALAACGDDSSEDTAASGDVVTIALGGPFSGSGKPTGDKIRAGAELAAERVNDSGGIAGGPLEGARIEFEEFDDANDPAQAATVMRDVVSDDGLIAYVGSGLSDAAITMAPVASRANFPMLSAYASSEQILEAAKDAKSVFVVPPTFPAYAQSVANQMLADGVERPGVINLQGTYGDGIADLTVDFLEDNDVDVVAQESFAFGDDDFRTQLGKIKAAGPDALVMVGLADSDAAILKQAESLKLDVPVYDPGGITNSATFLDTAGDLANGVTGNTPSAPVVGELGDELRADYQERTGEQVLPDPAAFAYEGVLAVAQALADGGSTSEDLSDFLHEIDIEDTGVGPLSFAADGSRVGGRLYVFQIREGAPSFLSGWEQVGPFEVKEIPLPR